MAEHRKWIRLLGGRQALVRWWDNEIDGEVVVSEPEFLSYIHDHTRRDAIEKARRLTNEADIKWNVVLA